MLKGLRGCPFRRFILKLLVLPVLLRFASDGFSKTYTVRADSILLARNGIDLQPILGIPWKVLPQAPVEGGIGRYHFLDSRQGWFVAQDTEQFPYHWVGGRWSAVRLPADRPITAGALFALNERNIWLSYQTGVPYKHNLLHFDGRQWIETRTPNTLRIVSLFFTSPESGWAGCEWGQLMRYDGGQWRLEPFPVSRHICGISFDTPSAGYAFTDIPVTLCGYDGKEWKTIPLESGGSAARDMLSMFWGFPAGRDPDIPDFLRQCREPVSPDLAADTVRIPCRAPLSVWVHHSLPVQAVSAGSRVLNARSFGPSEITFAGLADKTAKPDGSECLTYELFSKSGIERKVVLAAPRPGRDILRERVFSAHVDAQTRNEHGVCVSDLDGDGKEDLYAVAAQSTNRLYRFTAPYTQKTEIAENAGVAAGTILDDMKPNYDEGASSADTRNDGSQDLFVTSLYGPNILFERVRKGRFRNFGRSGLSRKTGFSASASWADVNCDGFIDLLVCNSDSGNALFINNGAGIFADRTAEAGLTRKPGSGSAVFGDINGDGRPDLFVPRGGRKSLLYVNEGPCGYGAVPYFREQSTSRGFGTEDTLSLSSSAVFGDPDNDGDLDLFVTNMAGPCRLYLNDGRGRFTDRTPSSGILEQGLSQTALFLDADNDGKQDLFIGGLDTSSLYINLGGARFARNVRERHKCFVSGMAWADLDGDGDPDIYLTDSFSASRWLVNRTDTDGYLRLKIRGTRSNADAVGAAVYLYDEGFAGDPDHLLGMREVSGSSICNSMSSRVVLFGVPDGRPKDALVRFPSGIRRTFRGLKPGVSRELFEEDGLGRLRSRAGKWLVRNGRDPLRQARAGVTALFLILTASSLAVLKRRSRSEGRIVRFAMAASFPVFLLLFYVLRDTGVLPGIVFPFAFGYAVSLAGFHYGSRILGGEQARMEALEKCFVSLNSFFHGEWGARKLNRLQLYAGNLGPETAGSREILEGLAESVRDFRSLVAPEIRRLLAHLQASGMFRPAVSEIGNRLRSALSALDRIEGENRGSSAGRSGSAVRTVESTHLLQESLRDLRKNLETHFTCRPAEWIEKTAAEYAAEGRPVSHDCRIGGGG
ncbi:MAG: VCBS repeat-containing protein, partial [bacterium]|nr:VCBS repeat-containing protein [bacterium]